MTARTNPLPAYVATLASYRKNTFAPDLTAVALVEKHCDSALREWNYVHPAESPPRYNGD